jgi:hypothetical protein
MTYQRDPDGKRRLRTDDGWGMLPLIGAVALVILAVLYFLSSGPTTRAPDRTVADQKTVPGPAAPGGPVSPPAAQKNNP